MSSRFWEGRIARGFGEGFVGGRGLFVEQVLWVDGSYSE